MAWSERDKEDLHVLAGRRGAPDAHAVRFRDIAGTGKQSAALRRAIQKAARTDDTASKGALEAAKDAIADAVEDIQLARDAANSVREDHDRLRATYDATAETLATLASEVVSLGEWTPGAADLRHVTDEAADLTAGDSAVTVALDDAAFGRAGTVTLREDAHARTVASGASFAVPAAYGALYHARRLRVAVLARRAATEPAASASLAYDAGDAGGVGPVALGGSITGNWSWHLAYVDVPAESGASASQQRVAILPDDAQDGGGIQVAEVIVGIAAEAADLPRVIGTKGLIEEIRALDVDADSAFGLWVQGIGVDVVDPENPDQTLVSRFEQTASTLADTKGALSTFAGFQVQAGNEVSFLEMYAADGAKQKVSLVKIGGDEILLDGTVGTEKLVAGTGANLIPDATMTQLRGNEPLHWRLAIRNGNAGDDTSLSVRTPGQSYSPAVGNAIQVFQNTGDTSGYGAIYLRPTRPDGNVADGVPIDPGEWYEGQVRASTHRCDGEMTLVFLRSDGSWAGSAKADFDFDNRGNSNNPGTWKRYWVKGKAPSDAVSASLRLQKNATASGQSNSYLFIHQPQIAETTSGASRPNAWSPGSTTVIDGGNIYTDSITGDKLRARIVDTDKLKLGGVWVENIRNGAVSGSASRNSQGSLYMTPKNGSNAYFLVFASCYMDSGQVGNIRIRHNGSTLRNYDFYYASDGAFYSEVFQRNASSGLNSFEFQTDTANTWSFTILLLEK